jgi:hypothetical protein
MLVIYITDNNVLQTLHKQFLLAPNAKKKKEKKSLSLSTESVREGLAAWFVI